MVSKYFTNRNIIFVLFIIASVRFINLGGFELQAWDEALYAIRAKAIVNYGDFFDQTAHSLNGLYSSTHPPVYVWLTSLSYTLFGINEFSSRLFSALAAIGVIIIVYLIGKIVFSKEVGFIAALFLSFLPFFSFWSRQGQFDVLLTFFITLSFFFYLKYRYELLDHRKLSINLLFCGISLGLSLMTKLFVGVVFLFIILFYEFLKEKRISFRFNISIMVPMLVVSLPWHLFMIFRYGNGDILFFFNQSDMITRTFVGIEGNAKDLGIFYFINQLIVNIPHLIVFFIFGLFKIFKSDKFKNVFLLWFIVYFIIISIFSTKLIVYLIPLFVPITIIASKTLFDYISNKTGYKSFSFLFLITCAFMLWSFDNNFRSDIKVLFTTISYNNLIFFLKTYFQYLIISMLLFSIVYVISIKRKLNYYSKLTMLLLLFIPHLFINLYHIISFDEQNYNNGITELSSMIKKRDPKVVYAIGNDINPQLAYYIEGIDAGGNNNKAFVRLEPKNGLESIKNRLNISNNEQSYVIVEKDEIALGRFQNYNQIIPKMYKNIFESKGYALFAAQFDN